MGISMSTHRSKTLRTDLLNTGETKIKNYLIVIVALLIVVLVGWRTEFDNISEFGVFNYFAGWIILISWLFYVCGSDYSENKLILALCFFASLSVGYYFDQMKIGFAVVGTFIYPALVALSSEFRRRRLGKRTM